MEPYIDKAFIQGTPEWLSLRKSKITATDAPIIMKVSPYKTPLQLYNQKVTTIVPTEITSFMQRGLDLEPIARELFCIKMGVEVLPKVIVKEWQMASLDGIDATGKCLVEIKCPGHDDHQAALDGKIPQKYFPQLQHQMHVCGIDSMYYFSFDGADGAIVEARLDSNYIEEMLIEEKKFYDCLRAKIAPEPIDGDYVDSTDPMWLEDAQRLKQIREEIKKLEILEETTKNRMILMSGGLATRGAGVSLSQVTRKGNVDYAKIPALKGVDLESYRKPTITSWRVNVT